MTKKTTGAGVLVGYARVSTRDQDTALQRDALKAGGKLIFHIFGALAEFERGIIRERTRAGLDAARARGRTGGRPPALSEKDIAAGKALLCDPDIPVEEVAKRLRVAPSTLYRHCRSAVMQDA